MTVKLALAGLYCFCGALVQLTHFSQGKMRWFGEYLMQGCRVLLILENFLDWFDVLLASMESPARQPAMVIFSLSFRWAIFDVAETQIRRNRN
jgi:hypothetical protein